MAVVLKNNEDDKEKEGQEGAQPQQTNTGASGSITASASPVAPATPDQAKRGSGQFTNLKNYIQANRNFNAAGGGLAGKVAGNLQQQGQQVEQQIGGAKEAFTQQKTQALEPIRQGAQLTQQAVANPMQFAQNQQNVQAVQAARDAEYKGPRSLADLQGRQSQAALQGQTQDFTTKVQQGQTEQGRFNLLRNMFARPSYSTGQQNLDNLLIQGQRDQIQRIADTGRTAARVNQQLRQNIDQSAQLGQQAAQEAQNIQQQTRGALNQRVQEENQAIQQRLAQAQRDQDRAIYDTARQLQTGRFNQELASQLGINQNQSLFGLPLTQFLSRGQDPTALNVATKDNTAQIRALKDLIGNTASEDSSKILAQFSNNPQAESFNPLQSFNIDANRLVNEINARQAAFNSERQNLLNQFAPEQNTYSTGRNLAQNFINNLGTKDFDSAWIDYVNSMSTNPTYREALGVSGDGSRVTGNFSLSAQRGGMQKFFEDSRALQQRFNPLQRAQVGNTASVDDFDTINPLTGKSKGLELLEMLGLARRTENS